MEALKTYSCEGKQYFLIKDLMSYKKGFRSETKFIEALKLEPVYGRICFDDESFRIDERRSKKLSKGFVSIDQIKEEEIKPRANKRVDGIELIEYPKELDSTEFCFFKDNQGVEHEVSMYGERTKESILFKLKDIEELFDINRLDSVIHHPKSAYELTTDFVKSKPNNHVMIQQRTGYVTFLTFKGLLKVINNCKSGRGKDFKEYLEDIVFAAVCGDTEQRATAIRSLAQDRLELLKEVLGKHIGEISCIYLLKTGHSHEGKQLYKYGFTKDLRRRFKEHTKTFGEKLDLETYFLLREDNLSKAETEVRNCLECFAYKSLDGPFKDCKELVAFQDSQLGTAKSILSSIYCRYSDSQLKSVNEIKIVYDQIIAKNKEEHKQEMFDLKLQNQSEIYEIEKKLDIAKYKLDDIESKHELAINLIQTKCELSLKEMKNASDALIAQIESKNNMLLEKLTSCNETYSREISLLKNKLDAKDKEIDNRDTLIAELKSQYEHLSSQGSQDLRLENGTLLGQVNEMKVKLEAVKVENLALEKELEESHMRADLLQFKLASK